LEERRFLPEWVRGAKVLGGMTAKPFTGIYKALRASIPLFSPSIVEASGKFARSCMAHATALCTLY